ncbi:unnamed protein product [Alternaria alternata]
MAGLLDDIEHQALSCTPNITQLWKQCRKDADRLCLLLQTFRMDVPLQERSTLSDSVFVILKGEKVERLISSYRSNYSLLTQAFISFMTANQNTTPSRTGMRPELQTIGRRLMHDKFMLRTASIEFDMHFSNVHNLQHGHSLQTDVATILETSMQYPVDHLTLEETVNLATRYCMYLLTVGRYVCVLDVLSKIKTWSKAVLPTNFEAETALSGKEAVAHALLGNLHTALQMFRKLRHSRDKVLGRSHISTLHSINGLGLVHHAMGNDREALHYHRTALRFKRKSLGHDDPDTLVSANNLGIVLLSQGRHERASNLFQSSLKGWLQAYGGDDLFVIAARSNLGITLNSQGKFDEAEHSHRYVYRKRQRILGPHHHETIKSKANLAITLNEQGRHSEAEAIYREAIEIFQARLGESHPDTLNTHINLATALHDQDKFNEAESIIASALPLVRKQLGDTHQETLKALEFRAILLQHMGRFLKAHGVVTEVYQAREKKLGRYHDDTQKSLRHMRDLAEDVEEEHAMHRFASVIPIGAC